MNTVLEIEKGQDNYAKTIAAKLDRSISRKIGMIDILGITVFAKYLKSCSIVPDLSNCMHKFPFALEKYKITDVNYNGHNIYVTTVFNENYIRIPKMHFKLGIEPDFYVIAEVHKSVEKGVIGGYIKAGDVAGHICDDKFYYLQKKDVLAIDKLVEIIKMPKEPKQTCGHHLEASSMFIKLTDNELKQDELDKLVRHLLTCENCRIKLSEVLQFDRVLRPEIALSYYTDKLHTDELKKENNKTFQTNKTELDLKSSIADLSDTQEVLNKTKETIDFIFKGKNVFDINLSKISIPNWEAKRKILITVAICFVMFLVLATGAGIKKTSQTLKPISGIETLSDNRTASEEEFYGSQDYYDSQDALNLDYSLSNSNGTKPSQAGIKNISWEVDKNIAEKENYKNFLQIVGKNIRLNLQNELLTATDFVRNHLVRINIRFSNGGKVGSLRMLQSSGSQQIDEIIQKCIYETFSYIKPPSAGFINKDLEMVLVIEL